MDLFKLSAKLTLDSSEYSKGLSNSEKTTKSFADKLSAKTVAIGTMMGKFAASAVEKTASVIKQTIGDSVKAYANYEQLVGGIDTLFANGGKSFQEYFQKNKLGTKLSEEAQQKAYYAFLAREKARDKVLENAGTAYKRAGMDMNTYMETVTGFSAGLIKSLKGDTTKAAEVADMAIVDMADNANKMGTPIESIQNAYQGFAKGNFTMLDNLKLGYGGTRTEMQKLLKDATKIQKSNGKNVKYNINNLADIYEAIHVIQTEMGITGTTAAEADKTISGSIASMKAAWTNLLIAFGDPNADIGAKIDELMDSVRTVAKNLKPVLGRVLTNVWEGLKAAALSLPGLVFGKTEDGKVNWPTWETVKEAANTAWEAIKAKALQLGGLVFGTKEDGSVNWPDPNKLLADFNVWWEDTARPAIEGAAVWVLKAFGVPTETAEQLGAIVTGWWDGVKEYITGLLNWALNLPSAPHDAGQQLHDIIVGWWGSVVDTAQSLLKWVIGIPGMKDSDGKTTGVLIKVWWDQNVVPKLKDALNFTLGLFGLPSVTDMVDRIKGWWELVKKGVGDLVLNIIPNILGLPTGDPGSGDGSGVHDSGFSSHGGGGHGFAKGLWDVPYNGYVAKLHRGEMILNTSRARDYREGGTGDMSAILEQFVAAVREGMDGATVRSFLNGKDVTDDVSRNTTRILKARRFAT